MDWSQVISTFIGGLLVFAGVMYAEYKKNNMEKKKLLLQKLDELYLTSIKFKNIYEKDLERSAKKIHNNESLQINNENTTTSPFVRLEMLVSMYFPSLKNSLIKLINSKNKFYEGFAYIFTTEAFNSQEKKEEGIKKIELLYQQINETNLNFQKEIGWIANKILCNKLSTDL